MRSNLRSYIGWGIIIIIGACMALPNMVPEGSSSSQLSQMDKIRTNASIGHTQTAQYKPNSTKSFLSQSSQNNNQQATSSGCIQWNTVSKGDVGKNRCVYGRVVKIMHNDSGNGSIEYVVRFKESNDHFLIKSENYWWPELLEGHCAEFRGKVQESPHYFFMQEVTGNSVSLQIVTYCSGGSLVIPPPPTQDFSSGSSRSSGGTSGGGGSSGGSGGTSGGGGGNCHPSYPSVCIPYPPPDLDCKNIPFRRFTVIGADPHNFDGDHDGIGCESG